jgi:sigma-E factor negative regulatory protein RseC
VRRLDADMAVVTSVRSVCENCASTGGCGFVKLSQLLCYSPKEFKVDNPVGVGPGDDVIIGAVEGTLVRFSLVVYLVPLLLLVAGAMVGEFATPIGFSRDIYAIGGFLAALAPSIAWMRAVNRRYRDSPDVRPVILYVRENLAQR